MEKNWPHPLGLRSPRPNNKLGRNTAPPISIQAALIPPRHTGGLYSHPKTKPHPPEGQDSAPPTSPFNQEAHQKPLYQLHSQGGRHQKQKRLQPYSLQKRRPSHRKLCKMKRQRNMSYMKEQDKTPEKQLSELEISNLHKRL